MLLTPGDPMAPKKFRWWRLRKVLQSDPTGTLEIVIALCFVLVPGVAMASGGSQMPARAEALLSALYITPRVVGVAAILMGAAQLWGAGTDWYRARAWISTVIAVCLTWVVVAYWTTGYNWLWTVPLMVGTILSEGFIAWRCWHERPVAVSPHHENGAAYAR